MSDEEYAELFNLSKYEYITYNHSYFADEQIDLLSDCDKVRMHLEDSVQSIDSYNKNIQIMKDNMQKCKIHNTIGDTLIKTLKDNHLH